MAQARAEYNNGTSAPFTGVVARSVSRDAQTTSAKPKGPPPKPGEPRAHIDADLTPEQFTVLREKLLSERKRLLSGMSERMTDAIAGEHYADEMDAAQRHTEQANLMRFADKERKLLGEIDRALKKMVMGEYGLCEGTDDPISYKRLELRPWTRYSVAHKEQLERSRQR